MATVGRFLVTSVLLQYRIISRLLIPLLLGVAACNPQAKQIADENPAVGSVASVDGVQIWYDVYGEGSPALVLVHGWSCDRSYWSEQVDSLSEHYRVVAVDLGGHGESGLGRKDWTIDLFGADVAAVVDSLGLDSVVLVGHSMGGDVIFQAARRLPGKVEALIMLDTYKQLGAANSDADIDDVVSEFDADFSGVTEKYVRGYFAAQADPSLVNKVAEDMAAAPPEVALSAIRSSFEHAREMPRLIEELRIPVVTINPDDAPTDLVSMEEHGVDVVIMPGVGHFLMMEDPKRFNELLKSILNEYL